MITFRLRDARLARLDAALTAVGDIKPTESLTIERDLWNREDWTVADATVLLAGLDTVWASTSPCVDVLAGDSTFAALGDAPVVTAAQAADVDAIPRRPGRAPSGFTPDIRTALGGDPAGTAAFDELVTQGHRLWLAALPADRGYPFDDVGTMLPLRLETLFDAPGVAPNVDPDRWMLSLRVIPQEPSISRHDGHIDAQELRAASAFWSTVWQSGALDATWLDGDAADRAFAQLCRAVEPARGAWLITATVPAEAGGTVTAQPVPGGSDESEPTRVVALPPRLSVSFWTNDASGDAVAQRLGSLPLDETAAIPATLDLPLFGSSGDADHSWLVDFDAAVSVGLAGSWPLPIGIGPAELGGISVVGLGDEAPDDLITAHLYAGTIGGLTLGAATNSVQGQSTGSSTATRDGSAVTDGAPDIVAWKGAARARLQAVLSPGSTVSGVTGQQIARFLVGAESDLPVLPVAAGPTDRGIDEPEPADLAPLMMRALWPALWGERLRDYWHDDGLGSVLTNWALEFMKPEGPLSALRFGDEAYGILPVSSLALWQQPPRTSIGYDVYDTALHTLSTAVDGMRRHIYRREHNTGTVRDADAATYASLLGRGGSSVLFQHRTGLDEQFIASVLGIADRDSFFTVLLENTKSALSEFGLPVVRPDSLGVTLGDQAERVRIPLVRPSRSSYWGQEKQLLRFPLWLLIDLLTGDGHAVNSRGAYTDLDRLFADDIVLGGDEYEPEQSGEARVHVLPDSLLIRVLVHATQTANEWRASGASGTVEEQGKAAYALAKLVDGGKPTRWNPGKNGSVDAATGVPVFPVPISPGLLSRLERAFGATLDAASVRLDPWATGLAWERLTTTMNDSRHRHRLGAYGWVDGPFDGQPGPTPSGLLHTPSHDQTLTATILRDRHREAVRTGALNEDSEPPWSMKLTGDTVRAASEIAEDVRAGGHIFEVVGREVERIVASTPTSVARPSAFLWVQAVRQKYPMYVDAPHPRQVCNGVEAIDGLLTNLGSPTPDFPITTDQADALRALDAALSTYADLLLIDGVTHSLSRQTTRAADAMDAASGLGATPELEFSRTKPSGYQLETAVLSVLPSVAAPAGAVAARLAEPSAAAFLDSRFGDAWTWTVTDRTGVVVDTVTLADLGLTPIDTLVHSGQLLEQLVLRRAGSIDVVVREEGNRAWQISDAGVESTRSLRQLGLYPGDLDGLDDETVRSHVLAADGASPTATIQRTNPSDARVWTVWDVLGNPLGLVDADSLGLTTAQLDALPTQELTDEVKDAVGHPRRSIHGPPERQQCAELSAAFGAPAAPKMLSTTDLPLDNSSAFEQLRSRYTAVYAAAVTAAKAARDAGELDPADESIQAAAIRDAAVWGITPIASPQDAETFYAAFGGVGRPANSSTFADVVLASATAFEARIAAARHPSALPSPADASAPLLGERQLKATGVPDGVQSLARALSQLVCASDVLPVLIEWDTATLQTQTGLVAQPQAGLDEDWLTVVAPVRPPLARLEALQLGADANALTTWTSSPGDPWRTDVVAENLNRRQTKSQGPSLTMPRLVVAYGPSDALAAAKAAVGVVDVFNESVPMPQRNTYAAFGFNAPAARAPQAILLAVPPVVGLRLDEPTLERVLQETRELTVARTLRADRLGVLDVIASMPWVAASGPLQLRLDRDAHA